MCSLQISADVDVDSVRRLPLDCQDDICIAAPDQTPRKPYIDLVQPDKSSPLSDIKMPKPLIPLWPPACNSRPISWSLSGFVNTPGGLACSRGALSWSRITALLGLPAGACGIVG